MGVRNDMLIHPLLQLSPHNIAVVGDASRGVPYIYQRGIIDDELIIIGQMVRGDNDTVILLACILGHRHRTLLPCLLSECRKISIISSCFIINFIPSNRTSCLDHYKVIDSKSGQRRMNLFLSILISPLRCHLSRIRVTVSRARPVISAMS